MNKIVNWICLFFSTTAFTGLVGKEGKGGGTLGTLVAFLVQVVMRYFAVPIVPYLALTIGSFFLGWLVVGPAERFLVSRQGGAGRKWVRGLGRCSLTKEVVSDLNQTNIDEVHGQLLAGLPVWLFGGYDLWFDLFFLLVSFVLFRMFDVSKVSLVGWAEERFKGTAFGVMIDDTVAGVFAFFCSWFMAMVLSIVLCV